MANQYTSLVALNTGEVLIDLTKDDVKGENVDEGIWFTDKTGKRQQGTSKKTVDASTATADAAEVLAGRTFGKGKELQTGTMPDQSGKGVELNGATSAVIPRGYYDGATKVTLSVEEMANLVPENIKEGVKILNVEGSFSADDMSSQSKEVTPSFEAQIVAPDQGKDFLSTVKVNAIPVTRTDNEAGGVTVVIG